jgi:hypothetical protein
MGLSDGIDSGETPNDVQVFFEASLFSYMCEKPHLRAGLTLSNFY